ncbi:hypothetical protein P3X46_011163 [Hevea brasiliensis]|uniref:RING-type E3 ubiquitin transferase n=1 Tax=Hevea brasiliensis TaxID=3981 RepID=A0ABQ9MIS4_HEVBR|nr:hypothetical protein P3X46_011163 [Hevea brasiliensis]
MKLKIFKSLNFLFHCLYAISTRALGSATARVTAALINGCWRGKYSLQYLNMKITDEDHHGITAIAIGGDMNSLSAVKWAVDNLVNGNNPHCILVHVQSKTLRLGENLVNLSKEGRPLNNQELQQLFLPYRGFCVRRGEVVIHDIDVPSALVDYVLHNKIGNIVLGASQRNALTRKFKNADIPSTLLKTAPESCAIYIISRGKVQTFRLASRPHHTPTGSTHSTSSAHSSSSSHSNSSTHSTSSANSTGFLCSSPQRQSPPPPTCGSRNANDTSITKQDNHWEVACHPIESMQSNNILSSQISFCESWKSEGSGKVSSNQNGLNDKFTFSFNTISPMASPGSCSSEGLLNRDSMSDVNEFSGPQSSRSTNTSCENLECSVTKEAVLAKHLVISGNGKAEEQGCSGSSKSSTTASTTRSRKEVQRQVEERRKTMEAMANNDFRCRRYTMDEIEVATNHFALSNKIGEGGYGPVFKGILNHINVAIKILRPDLSQGQRQFRQEVDVLSSTRHPNMVILLGACPEYGCLVFELMENGIHRDLKPANILLDLNFVSKIGDVGLARLLPPSVANDVSQYHMTAAVSTFYYIDPKYQQTGMLNVKLDLYSFGVVLLQLLIAKPPMGLSYHVQDAINNGTFPDMLDKSLTNWLIKEALLLANIAVKCWELRKKDRPDLASDVLPGLKRLRDFALGHEFVAKCNEDVEHETVIPLSSPIDLISEAKNHTRLVNISNKCNCYIGVILCAVSP